MYSRPVATSSNTASDLRSLVKPAHTTMTPLRFTELRGVFLGRWSNKSPKSQVRSKAYEDWNISVLGGHSEWSTDNWF